MSSLSSFNYEDVGDTYEEILAHYQQYDCSYAQRKLKEFENDAKQMEHLNKNYIAFKKYGVIEQHIRAIHEFLDSKPSCAVMGGRSKRSRRAKKSKRAKRTRRARR